MKFSIRHLANKLGALSLSAALSGCAFTIEHQDLFQLRDAQVPVEALKLVRNTDAASIVPISLDAQGRTFKGYHYKIAKPTRAILFFAGSGYGAPSAMGRVVAAFADEASDIYFLSYGEQGEIPPKINQVYAMASKLAQRAQADSQLPSGNVAAIGHSFGGWITLHLAAKGEIKCAAVLGGASNVVETSYALVPRIFAPLVDLRAAPEVATLDSMALAGQVNIPTLVLGSKGDRSTPESLAQRIYASLRLEAQREIFISEKVAHESYLRDAEVTGVVRDFLRRRCA